MAAIRLDYTMPGQRELVIGDVLMVAKELDDKHKKGKTFTWRFFALVTKVSRNQRLVEVLVLDEKEREPMRLPFNDARTTIHYIPDGEWPDGVHAFRTKAILDGRVEIGIF